MLTEIAVVLLRHVQEISRVLLQSLAVVLNPVLADLFIRRRPQSAHQHESALEERLQELAKTMRLSADLVAEVEAEFEVRRAAVEKLKGESETAKRVAQLSEEQSEAVAVLLRGTVVREGRKTFWLGALVNLVFFALGALVTLLVDG